MKLHYTNNATTTLTQSITTVSTTLNVASTALFPQGVDFNGGERFYITLENSLFGTREICKVTGMTVNALTVERGQDGTLAQEFDATTTIVERRAVASDYNNFVQADTLDEHINDADAHPQYASDADVSAAVAAHAAASDPHPTYAKDTDLTAAIIAHVALPDPHSQYTNSTELSAAIAAHVALANPHSQYSTNTYVNSAVATHAAESNPHPSYLKGASAAEVTAKTATTTGITPSLVDHLWSRYMAEHAVSTSGGAGSSGKLPLLDSTGKLDSSFVPVVGGVSYRGAMDAVNDGPPAITHFAGDFYFHNGEDGTVDTGWTGVGGDAIALGDQLIYNALGEWDLVPTVIDTDQYLRRDGTTAMTGDLDVNGGSLLNTEIEYTTNAVRFWRSVVPGERPAGGTRDSGELYINLTDMQIGAINASTNAVDLLAITTFSTGADYAAGKLVVYNGSVYRALVSVTAGAFNAAQWKELTAVGTSTTEITQSAHGFTSANRGAPMRFNGTSWVLSQASSSVHHQGVLVAVTGTDTFTITTDGVVPVDVAVNGGAALVAGTLYYASTATAGQVTSTAPGDLQAAHPVYLGVSTGTAYLLPSPIGYAQYDYVDAEAAAAAAAAIIGLASTSYVDTAVNTSAGLQVNKSGDTMTGALTVTNATLDGHALNRITADGRFAPLSHTHSLAEITGDGTMAAVNDAPSDGKSYARNNGTWAEVISGGGGGTSDHTALINRGVADQHPTSAITGLDAALAAKQDTITGGASTIASANLTASRALMSDGSGKVVVSAVSSTSLGYLTGVTGAIQTQLDAKVPLTGTTMTGFLTLYADPQSAYHAVTKQYVDARFAASMTPSMALVTDATGKVTPHATVSDTELGYLDGVTSGLQAQLNGKQPQDADLTAIAALAGSAGFLKKTATDTWALDTNSYSLSAHNHDAAYATLGHNHDGTYAAAGHHHDAAYAALGHTHDAAYSALGHTHDDRYYTESEIGTLLSGYSTTSHNHDSAYVSIVGTPTNGNFPTLTSGGELVNSAYGPSSFATSGHDHSGVYQPADAQLTDVAGLAITKGNLIVGNGSNFVAVGIGTNDQILLADSTQAAGVRWATNASGDHGGLTGLADDDHTQYALADGSRGSFAATTHNHDAAYISLVSTPTAGNFPTLTAGGELQNSAYSASSFATSGHNHDSAYISVVGTPTTGNFPTLTAGGELQNSAYNSSSFATAGHNHTGVYATESHNHDSAYISIVSTPTNGNFPTLTAGGELANSAYSASSFATSGHNHDSTYQPLDSDLTAIAALTHTKGKVMFSNGTAWQTLTVGTDTQILIADSAQTLGVKWGVVPAPSGFTANRAIVSNAGGTLTAATTTDTEIGYVNGVTSAIQTQLNARVLDTGDTMTGDLAMSNNDIVDVKTLTFYAEYDNGNSGTADTITLTNGMKQKSTLTDNATLTITATNALPGHYQLRLIQDATGGRAVTWSGLTSTKWLGSAAAPSINTAASGETIVNIFVSASGTIACQSAQKVGA